jgi:hypothetical protein
VDPNEGSTSNIIKDPSYSSDEEGDPNHDWSDDSVLNSSGSLQQDNLGKRRMSTQDKRKAIHESWRASIEEAEFERLEKVYDPMEMRRQELVWEFHHNERLFVESMRTLIHLFVQPLRAQDKRTWIAGLSPEVMKLFDWLDDISNLHEQLLDALEIMRKDHEHIIILFSETVQPFIPLMELYQPYIVHMDETIKQIVAMTLDPASDFGEFVRMQSALLRCGESLEEMMKHPLSHLQEYVPFFQVSKIVSKESNAKDILDPVNTHTKDAPRLFPFFLIASLYARYGLCTQRGQSSRGRIRADQESTKSSSRSTLPIYACYARKSSAGPRAA